MSEIVTKLSWGLLILIHAAPAAALFRPELLGRLYGIEPKGDLGVLMLHRGALFLAIVAVCLYAIIEPEARRAASIVAAISVLGFLGLYGRAGSPAGSLRKIAQADLVALPPLAWVTWQAWLGV